MNRNLLYLLGPFKDGDRYRARVVFDRMNVNFYADDYRTVQALADEFYHSCDRAAKKKEAA